MGGHTQAQTHLQMLTHLCHDGDDSQAAITAPRWAVDPDHWHVNIESRFDDEVVDGLRGAGHDVRVDPALRRRHGPCPRDRMPRARVTASRRIRVPRARPRGSSSYAGPSVSNTRIWTIPNVISLLRLACVPVFLWLLWAQDEPVAAALLLAVLGATDWVDGYIARHFDQGSELGKILDPTADRVMLVAAAVALLVEDLPVAVDIVIWVVLIREVIVGDRDDHAGARRRAAHRRGLGREGGNARSDDRAPAVPLGERHRFRRVERVRLVRGMVLRHRGYRTGVLRRRQVRPRGACGAARRTRESRRRSYERGGAGMKAVILAGGEGTRLRPLTSNQPKPMMPIANLPMMEHIVGLLGASRLRRHRRHRGVPREPHPQLLR